MMFGIGIGNGNPTGHGILLGRVTTTERSAEQYESARHTATPHGECHGLWMAVGVAGQPILPQ
jgi:hypothetical protein